MATPKAPKAPKPDAAVDPQLKQEVHQTFKEAKHDTSTGNLATANEPADTVPPAAYQGHDRR